jgi:hypothetical protein
MLRNVRKKVASAISKVEEVEDFQYGSWLKACANEGVDIIHVTSELQDTSFVTYDINPPDSNAFLIELEEIDVLPQSDKFFFGKVQSNAIFFAMHTVSLDGMDVKDIEPKQDGYVAKDVEFLIPYTAVREYQVVFKLSDPVDYKVKFDDPEITDHLQSMKPEVLKIELLNIEHLDDLAEAVEVRNIDLYAYAESINTHKIKLEKFSKVKTDKFPPTPFKKAKKIYKVRVPGMGDFESVLSEIRIKLIHSPEIFESVVLNFSEIPSWSTQVSIDHTNPYKYYDAKDEELIELNDFKINEFKDPRKVKDILKLILKNVQKIDWDKRKDLHFPLLPYEEEGAKYLAENDSALLQDEFGLDKIKESIAALKFHFGNRAVKSALVICSSSAIGNTEFASKFGLELGWTGKLAKWSPELPYIEVGGEDDARADQWQKSSLIYIADHDAVLNDFHLKILNNNMMSKFDCVILDEAQFVLNKGEKGSEFLSALKPKILWALTSIISDKFKDELNTLLKTGAKIESVKIRRKEELKQNAQRFIWNEHWLNLDNEQEGQYNETMVDCQKNLRKILETGNPYRFQANIFTLVHTLKQVSNFAAGNVTSPKTELLLEQLSIIKQNEKKALILSQYERQGTRKIEKFLQQNGLKYVLAPAGLSVDEMAKSIELFKNRKEITAFITDAKISRLRFGETIIPYIIKFDQWWNPISLWEVEDIFNINEQNKFENINVFSYNILNSIDDQVKELLITRGLVNKNMMDIMPVKVFDELISVDDWLKVFKMPVSEEEEQGIQPAEVLKNLKKMTLADFRTTLSKLFFKLGYTNLDIIDELNSSSYNLVGESKRNNRSIYLFARIFMEDKVLVKDVKEIILQSGSSADSKIFIITKGKFNKGCEKLESDKVTLLDGIKLSDYLIRLNIVEKKKPLEETDEPEKDIVKKGDDPKIKWID